MIDFTNIGYLKFGNAKQKQAYVELVGLNIFEDLKKYNPILAGTIPIEIDLPESDLDIICECKNLNHFSDIVSGIYSNKTDFEINFYDNDNVSVVAKFRIESFEIEIFCQNKPTENQNAYKHMVIEYNILKQKGDKFKSQIIKLKSEGLKTEPAFAKLLQLEGDPYEELLKYIF